jgi:hypothetical protein
MDDQIIEDEMGRTYSTHGSDDKYLFNVGTNNLKEREDM